MQALPDVLTYCTLRCSPCQPPSQPRDHMRLGLGAALGAAVCCMLSTPALGGGGGAGALRLPDPAGSGRLARDQGGWRALHLEATVGEAWADAEPHQQRPAKKKKPRGDASRGWLHHDAAAPNLVEQLNKHRVGPNPHTEEQRMLLVLVATIGALAYYGNKHNVCCTTKGNGRSKRVERARPTGTLSARERGPRERHAP